MSDILRGEKDKCIKGRLIFPEMGFDLKTSIFYEPMII